MSARLRTHEEMVARLPSMLQRGPVLDALAERDRDVLAWLDEIAEWSFDEQKMLDRLNALRAELRGDR